MDGRCEVEAKTILLATGVQWRTLQTPGLRPLIGKGVLYGAARTEAHTVIGKNIFIIGAGNSAGQAALFFSEYANCVTILVRGPGLIESMSQYLIAQLGRRPNIRIETGTELVSASGDAHLESICTSTNGELRVRDAAALYVMIGATANSSWLPKGLQRDKNGFICTGHDVQVSAHQRSPFLLETSLPGIFCAGDIRHASVKRVASGIGEGSMAISFIHQFVDLGVANEQVLAGRVFELSSSSAAD
jgi:thioredoxin reductase (NADPH)